MTATARPSLTLTLTPPQTDTHSLHADKTRRKEGRKGGREEHAVSGGITKRSCTAQDCFALACPARLFTRCPCWSLSHPTPPTASAAPYLQPLAVRAWRLRSLLRPSLSLSVPVSAGTCKIHWLCCHALGLESAACWMTVHTYSKG